MVRTQFHSNFFQHSKYFGFNTLLSFCLCSPHFLQFVLLVSQLTMCFPELVDNAILNLLKFSLKATINCWRLWWAATARLSVFQVFLSGPPSHSLHCFAVLAMISFNAGTANRINTSPGTYIIMCSLIM